MIEFLYGIFSGLVVAFIVLYLSAVYRHHMTMHRAHRDAVRTYAGPQSYHTWRSKIEAFADELIEDSK